VAQRVQAARLRALRRWGGINSRVSSSVLGQHALEGKAQELLDSHLRAFGGLRSTHRITTVAWTLCDLAGRERPNADDIIEATEWHQPLWQES
jgi:magnesium chelatase family protein